MNPGKGRAHGFQAVRKTCVQNPGQENLYVPIRCRRFHPPGFRTSQEANSRKSPLQSAYDHRQLPCPLAQHDANRARQVFTVNRAIDFLERPAPGGNAASVAEIRVSVARRRGRHASAQGCKSRRRRERQEPAARRGRPQRNVGFVKKDDLGGGGTRADTHIRANQARGAPQERRCRRARLRQQVPQLFRECRARAAHPTG